MTAFCLLNLSHGGIRTAFQPMGGGKKTDPLTALRDRIRKATGDKSAEIVNYAKFHNQEYLNLGIALKSSDIVSGELFNYSSGYAFIFASRFSTPMRPHYSLLCSRFDFGNTQYTVYLPQDYFTFNVSNGVMTTSKGQKSIASYYDFDTEYEGDTELLTIGAAYSEKPQTAYPITMDLYSFTVRNESGVAIRNIVPIFSEGSTCFYDIVSRQIFSNLGSGALSNGGVISTINQLTPAQREAWFGKK